MRNIKEYEDALEGLEYENGCQDDVDVMRELLEKEKPMKVDKMMIERNMNYSFKIGVCPKCNSNVTEEFTYCYKCGQHLKF